MYSIYILFFYLFFYTFFVPFNLGKEVLVKLYEYYLLIAVKTLITVIRYNLQLLLIDDLMSATRLKLYIVKTINGHD